MCESRCRNLNLWKQVRRGETVRSALSAELELQLPKVTVNTEIGVILKVKEVSGRLHQKDSLTFICMKVPSGLTKGGRTKRFCSLHTPKLHGNKRRLTSRRLLLVQTLCFYLLLLLLFTGHILIHPRIFLKLQEVRSYAVAVLFVFEKHLWWLWVACFLGVPWSPP